MSANWYKLFSMPEFLDTDLVSRNLTLNLQGIGSTSFLITRGNCVSVMYDDTFLPVNFLNKNPYIANGYAVYQDVNEDVWFGFESEEE